MNFGRFGIVFLGVLSYSLALAQQPPAVSADIRLSRIAEDRWRADYVFSRPVTALRMEPVGDFRRDAWTILSPGASMAADAQADVVSMKGRPFRQLSVEIRSYSTVVPKQYLAVDLFSDGGRLFYLGFLRGQVVAGGASQPLITRVELAGRKGEGTLAPPARAGSDSAYAYFGQMKPTPAGAASAMFDPAIPGWVKAAILDATSKISDYYANTYQRKPSPPLVLMVTMGGTGSAGLSMKGGAIGSQIAYRLSGNQFATDHPAKRVFIAQLVAHEMAHVWQQQVAQGGVGEETPWVHEGGAEAMAHDALLKTAIWSAADGNAFVARALKRCADEGDGFASYEGIYACGFKRFHATGLDPALLWHAMMQLTEQTAEPYSPNMLERAATSVRAGAGGAVPGIPHRFNP